MSRKPNKNNSARVQVRVSAEVERYLEELSTIGVHGVTPSEVARTLIQNEVERLAREGILKLRRRRS